VFHQQQWTSQLHQAKTMFCTQGAPQIGGGKTLSLGLTNLDLPKELLLGESLAQQAFE
jgi:hypothetical protein